MPSPGEVRDWIAWIRANPADDAGPFPVVTDVKITGLWDQDASEHFTGDRKQREQTLDIFAAELIRDPTDVTPRFVALHFYDLARVKAEVEIEAETLELKDELPQGEADAETEAVRAEYRQDAGLLIGLLPIEQCPSDWDFIEWEILNSCLVGDLGRILKLLDRAEEEHLINRAQAQVLRGQYRFVVAMEGMAELESQAWRPKLYDHAAGPPRDRLMGITMLALGMASTNRGRAVEEAKVELFKDASHELDKAAAAIPQIPAPYTAALARSYFALGKFRDAAEQYHRLLSAKLAFGDLLDLKKAVYESLTMSHESAGDAAAAKAALSMEIQEYPNEKGLCLRMAELEARGANYDPLVAEWIRKEMELSTEADKDWRLSTILALGETRGSLEELRRTVPQLREGIEWGLERFWSTFRKLDPEAARACTEGEVDAALSSHLELFPEKFEKDAASKWAAAVEVELREKPFHDFREAARQRDDIRAAAEAGLSSGDKTEVLSTFLLKGGRLSLGQMLYVLRECLSAAPEDVLFHALREWLGREHPRFDTAEVVRRVSRIVDFRNPLVHREGNQRSPHEARDLCQKMLDTIASTY